jgi:putative hydrolases of HD superfamily
MNADNKLSRAMTLARIALAFGRVERVTRHENGVRPETDTDHTVMLGLIACELAPPHLDRARIAAFALVHDLVEVYAGDAQTLVISADDRAAKKAREDAAQARLVAELGDGSWLAGLLATYEHQREPEARFVRLVDKVLPKLTHAFNGCVAAKALTDQPGFFDAHQRQLRQLLVEYPEFPDALELLHSSMLHAEECWQASQGGDAMKTHPPLVKTTNGGEAVDAEPVVVFANPPRFVGGRCEDCHEPAPFPSDLCAACVKRRRDAGEIV